jgi:CubicO group peptidase (beta-lactamase class C family)
MTRHSLGRVLGPALVSAAILVGAAGGISAAAPAQLPGHDAGALPSGERWAEVSERIVSGLGQRNIPSVSIAVSRHGRVVWERSFGWADRENHVKATPDTVYSLASITKSMIATGLMVLVREGKIDLDAPVERYIGPGLLTVYEGKAEDVTVRRLLHHTAGLPQHFNYFYTDEPGRPHPLEETIRRFGIIIHPPGKAFDYANLGFAILGDVIARVSGRPLSEFMGDEVYEPLGMTRAAFDPDLSGLANLAVKYDTSGKPAPLARCDTPGAGSAYASVRDLLRFGMFHLRDHLKGQKPILTEAAVERMQTEKDGAAHLGGSKESYGLGWFFAETAGGVRTVWHEGGWTGASAMLKLVPSEDAAVAVAMNMFDTEFVNKIADEAIRVVLPGFRDPAQPAAAPAAAQASPPAAPSFKIPAGTWSGEIRAFGGAIPLVLEKSEGGELVARLGGPSAPARPVRSLPAIVLRRPGQFKGSFAGPLGDADAARYPHSITLSLELEGDELVGVATAMTLSGLGITPDEDQRMRFMLPYRVSLKRTVSPPRSRDGSSSGN